MDSVSRASSGAQVHPTPSTSRSSRTVSSSTSTSRVACTRRQAGRRSTGGLRLRSSCCLATSRISSHPSARVLRARVADGALARGLHAQTPTAPGPCATCGKVRRASTPSRASSGWTRCTATPSRASRSSRVLVAVRQHARSRVHRALESSSSSNGAFAGGNSSSESSEGSTQRASATSSARGSPLTQSQSTGVRVTTRSA